MLNWLEYFRENLKFSDSNETVCKSIFKNPHYRDSLFREALRQKGRRLDDQSYSFARDGHNEEAILEVSILLYLYHLMFQPRVPLATYLKQFFMNL